MCVGGRRKCSDICVMVCRVLRQNRTLAMRARMRDYAWMQFTFEVKGRPVPKARPRFASGHAYTPVSTVIYEALVRACAVQAVPLGWPLDARYSMQLQIVRGDMRPFDCDNVFKGVSDALNGVAWKDDSQVDAGGFMRTLDRANPHVVISIWTLDDPFASGGVDGSSEV